MLRLLIIILCFTLYQPISQAQTSSQRLYTDDEPLVFEHSYNLYPYSYINEHGEPEGYFIELIDLLMKELGIPYVVELKPQKDTNLFDTCKLLKTKNAVIAHNKGLPSRQASLFKGYYVSKSGISRMTSGWHPCTSRSAL